MRPLSSMMDSAGRATAPANWSKVRGRRDHLAARVESWLWAMPTLALAYPLLIQPLMKYQPVETRAQLDLMTNVSNAEASPANQAFWVFLLSISLFAFRRRLRAMGTILNSPVMLCIVAYLTLSCLSVFWSPVPLIAARRAGLQVIVVLCTLGATYLTPNRKAVLSATEWLFASVIFVNLAAVLTQPPGRLGGYLGIYADKNILGMIIGLGLLFLGHAAITRRGLTRLFFLATAAAALVILLLSESETSLILAFAAPIFAGLVIYLASKTRFPILVSAIFLILAGATVVVSLMILTGTGTDQAIALAVGDPTFSGRTEIWSFVLGEQRLRPMFGLGYASFWGAGEGSAAFEAAPGFIKGLLQAHSGYLDVMLETGYVGLLLLVLMILAAIAQVQTTWMSFAARQWLVLSVIAFVALHNGLESSWFRSFASPWVVFLVSIATCLPGSDSRRPSTSVQRSV